MRLTSFVASLAVLATEAFAFFEAENYEMLDLANFEETVLSDDENLWLVTFYTDWCPYCEQLAIELTAAMADPILAGVKVKYGAVNSA